MTRQNRRASRPALTASVPNSKKSNAGLRHRGTQPPPRLGRRWPILSGIITPSALHYERHHAGIPDIDPAVHRLLIHGDVARSLMFSIDDLKRLPQTHRICFIECSGNSYREWEGPGGANVQQTHGLTSCSDWAGVRLATVLGEVGISDSASWVIAEGADGAAMTRSIPLQKCLDDVLLAYSQNGEALRPEQGYPLRLVVPGYEGSISVKWLRRLRLTDTPYYSREETSKYTDLMPDGKAREFSLTMEAKSGHHYAVCQSTRHRRSI